MSEAGIDALARRAGIAVEWRDYAGEPHRVSSDTLRRILAALGLPCDTASAIAQSHQALEASRLPPLVTARVDEPIDLPIPLDDAARGVRIVREDGTTMDVVAKPGPHGTRLPAIAMPGYHIVEIGNRRTTVAVAPARCLTVASLAPNERVWGLAAQVYGLRTAGDCGIGDIAGVADLVRQAAVMKADALALSPLHALFAADPGHYSPYSPSSRLFYNPLNADARALFGDVRVNRAADEAGVGATAAALEQSSLIDWVQSARVKMSVFRTLFADFFSNDLTASPPSAMAADFLQFCTDGGTLLENHARFEALHAVRLAADPKAWNWTDWNAPWRDPASAEVNSFAEQHKSEIAFHCFLQWIADRSLAAAQRDAKKAGMRIGLIADLAVGMSGAGSHAWTSQDDILVGLEIGAPPDLYNTEGQNWGLTTFSPRALAAGGFAPFLATLRAAMRHSGGVRIDHVMGLLRLWVVPRGADAKDGAYLTYPIDDLMRLTALESHRHRGIVIGEDLGTVPSGFRERLSDSSIYGMRVLWFERDSRHFAPPQSYSADTAAMTSTHDLPTVAGWWRGKDIDTRAELRPSADAEIERTERSADRRRLWRAFRRAGAAAGPMPPPDESGRAAAAAVNFVAQTRSDLVLLPLEDGLGLEDQPNLPGTIDEHPNWRRRYPGPASELLETAEVRHRLAPLARRRSS